MGSMTVALLVSAMCLLLLQQQRVHGAATSVTTLACQPGEKMVVKVHVDAGTQMRGMKTMYMVGCDYKSVGVIHYDTDKGETRVFTFLWKQITESTCGNYFKNKDGDYCFKVNVYIPAYCPSFITWKDHQQAAVCVFTQTVQAGTHVSDVEPVPEAEKNINNVN